MPLADVGISIGLGPVSKSDDVGFVLSGALGEITPMSAGGVGEASVRGVNFVTSIGGKSGCTTLVACPATSSRLTAGTIAVECPKEVVVSVVSSSLGSSD